MFVCLFVVLVISIFLLIRPLTAFEAVEVLQRTGARADHVPRQLSSCESSQPPLACSSYLIPFSVQEQLFFQFLVKMWMSIVGKLDQDSIQSAFEATNLDSKAELSYEDLQLVLLQGLMQKEFLPMISHELVSLILSDPIQ